MERGKRWKVERNSLLRLYLSLLLAYPCGQEIGAEDLQKMVWEANREAVLPEEFLSDHVYFCHMDSGEVDLCQEGRTTVCRYGREDVGWNPDITGVFA